MEVKAETQAASSSTSTAKNKDAKLIGACLLSCGLLNLLKPRSPCLGNGTVHKELVFPHLLPISTIPIDISTDQLTYTASQERLLLSSFQIMACCHLKWTITIPLTWVFCVNCSSSDPIKQIVIYTKADSAPTHGFCPASIFLYRGGRLGPWLLCPFSPISLQVRFSGHCGLAPDRVRWGIEACLACGFLICPLWETEKDNRWLIYWSVNFITHE